MGLYEILTAYRDDEQNKIVEETFEKLSENQAYAYLRMKSVKQLSEHSPSDIKRLLGIMFSGSGKHDMGPMEVEKIERYKPFIAKTLSSQQSYKAVSSWPDKHLKGILLDLALNVKESPYARYALIFWSEDRMKQINAMLQEQGERPFKFQVLTSELKDPKYACDFGKTASISEFEEFKKHVFASLAKSPRYSYEAGIRWSNRAKLLPEEDKQKLAHAVAEDPEYVCEAGDEWPDELWDSTKDILIKGLTQNRDAVMKAVMTWHNQHPKRVEEHIETLAIHLPEYENGLPIMDEIPEEYRPAIMSVIVKHKAKTPQGAYAMLAQNYEKFSKETIDALISEIARSTETIGQVFSHMQDAISFEITYDHAAQLIHGIYEHGDPAGFIDSEVTEFSTTGVWKFMRCYGHAFNRPDLANITEKDSTALLHMGANSSLNDILSLSPMTLYQSLTAYRQAMVQFGDDKATFLNMFKEALEGNHLEDWLDAIYSQIEPLAYGGGNYRTQLARCA